MADHTNTYTDPSEALRRIAEKTKRFKTPSPVPFLTEITCYVIFIGIIALAFYLPGYLEVQLDAFEDEIGFYTLDPEDRKSWGLIIQTTLVILSLFPLVFGILLRLMSKMNRLLSEVHGIAGTGNREQGTINK